LKSACYDILQLSPKILLEGARERSRYGHRDATMILVAYQHGFRVSELCAMRWDQVDLGHKNIQHTVRYTELSPERFKTVLGEVIPSR
jgi:site-specific recombinase XerD